MPQDEKKDAKTESEDRAGIEPSKDAAFEIEVDKVSEAINEVGDVPAEGRVSTTEAAGEVPVSVVIPADAPEMSPPKDLKTTGGMETPIPGENRPEVFKMNAILGGIAARATDTDPEFTQRVYRALFPAHSDHIPFGSTVITFSEAKKLRRLAQVAGCWPVFADDPAGLSSVVPLSDLEPPRSE